MPTKANPQQEDTIAVIGIFPPLEPDGVFGRGGWVHLPVPLFPSLQYCASQSHSLQINNPFSLDKESPPYQPALQSVQLVVSLKPLLQ